MWSCQLFQILVLTVVDSVLSPTPPFYAISTRLKIVGILFGLAVVASLTSSYLIVKGAGFVVGLAFFGEPVFQRTMDYLNTNIPDWKKYLDLQMYVPGIPAPSSFSNEFHLGPSSKESPQTPSSPSHCYASANSTAVLYHPLPPLKPQTPQCPSAANSRKH